MSDRFERVMFAASHAVIYLAFLGCVGVLAAMAYDSATHSPLTCAPDVPAKVGK